MDRIKKSTPIRPERLMKSISKYSDDDAVFSIDVGTSTVWSTRLNLSVNNKFIISSWLGNGLRTVSKIAFPKRQAISISGDGAFQMVMQDFATAVQYDLP